MIKSLLSSIVLLLSLQITVLAADDEVQANVAISIQQENEIWTGQQVTLNLDLKTTGFSFSNTHFNLPEVSGAFLMQTDTTTIKFSEKTDGVAWQIIRYPLALYPQKPGQLEVPSINVRFTTSAGFGSAEQAFKFKSEPLQIHIQTPPGVKPGDLVITTSSFDLSYNWQPESGTAQTGDALTLTVTRQANDISAMLLPPLPVFHIEGLAAYPQAPEVKDKTNRGDLTGERTDSIIWVVEKPGTYNIPAIRFQWFDPVSLELKQQIIPGLNLNIPPSAADMALQNASATLGQLTKDYFWLFVFIFVGSVAITFWFSKNRKTPHRDIESERSTFKALQLACKNDQASQTYAALHTWFSWVSPAVTLAEFAQSYGNAALSNELNTLQKKLISAEGNWQGNKLLIALRRNRSEIKRQNTVASRIQLAPLNP